MLSTCCTVLEKDVHMVHRKRSDIASAKLKVLDMLIENPDLTDYDLARKLGSDYRTMRKYRLEMLEKLDTQKAEIEKKIEAKIKQPGGIWQRITKLLK